MALVTVLVLDNLGNVLHNLTDGSKWILHSCDPSGVTLTRETVTSPWVDGEFDVHTTKGAVTWSLSVTAQGASTAAVESLVDSLLEDTSLPDWRLSFTVDDVTRVWRCRAADSTITPIEAAFYEQYLRTVNLTVPAQPNPKVTGI